MKSVALLGEFTPTFKPHPATSSAIEHSRDALGIPVDGVWVSTQDIEPSVFTRSTDSPPSWMERDES